MILEGLYALARRDFSRDALFEYADMNRYTLGYSAKDPRV